MSMATKEWREGSSGFASRFSYDVFLSFRGEDTRKAFTDHLYNALLESGFRTFRDENEIERGEHIASELRKAIQQSRILIVVFSKGYASSTWCLDELAMILESKRSVPGRLRVLPVYYGVNPSEVGRQRGAFEAAFSGYEARIQAEKDEGQRRCWEEKVIVWKKALGEAANLAGMELRNEADGYESKFVQKIVAVVREKLNRPILSIGSTLVGIHPRVRNIMKWLQDGSSDVGAIGICGMGGVGKTTIAKYVYNMNYRRFNGSCFLANIREVSEQPDGLLRLQRQIVFDLTKMRKEKISNIDEGIMKIKNIVSNKQVLLVLDDVDQTEQFDAIMRMRGWFHPGSKIIITTRYKHFLKANQVNEVHEVESLDGNESLTLFSLHAFGQDHPLLEYVECSKMVVEHCGGLPLALRVLGSSLFGRSLEVWQSAIKKLVEYPHAQVHQKLTLSYDSLLDDHDKNLFLHIACFLVGKDKEFAIAVLDGCDFFTKIGIENLIDRSLLTIDKYNIFEMHQLLQDMGKEIIRQESPNDPGKRSRLWNHNDSYKVLKEKRATEAIECLALDMQVLARNKSSMKFINTDKKKRPFEESSSFSDQGNPNKRRRYLGLLWNFATTTRTGLENPEDIIETDAFARMQKLTILQLKYVRTTGSYKEFPKGLRWLCWREFHLSSIPNEFPVEGLIALEMPYSRLEQIWKGNKFLGALKILDLSHSDRLTKTPCFSQFPNLERLILKECINLGSVHESIVDVEGLVLLNLEGCKRLRYLPKGIRKLKYLEILIISGCLNLEGLSFDTLESLKVLYADGIGINHLVSTSKELKPWHASVSSWLSKPIKSPANSSISLPRSLVKLSLVGCNLTDDAFPIDLRYLSLLNEIDLGENPIYRMPDFVKYLGRLRELSVSRCPKIQSLLGVPHTVERLYLTNCNSLERITWPSSSSGKTSYIHHAHFDKLAELENVFKLEPIGEVHGKIINSFGLSTSDTAIANKEMSFEGIFHKGRGKGPTQGLYEFGIFNIFLQKNEVPTTFSCRRKGCSLSFTVPPLANELSIKGLNVSTTYALSGKEEIWGPHPLFCQISNKTKDLIWAYSPMRFVIPEANQSILWLSFWNFGDQLEPENELDISIIVGDSFQVMECGVEVVYKDQEEEHQTSTGPFSWERVIGGDLSKFQLSATRFYLCRHVFRPIPQVLTDDNDCSETATSSASAWFDNLFGSSVDSALLKSRVMSPI